MAAEGCHGRRSLSWPQEAVMASRRGSGGQEGRGEERKDATHQLIGAHRSPGKRLKRGCCDEDVDAGVSWLWLPSAGRTAGGTAVSGASILLLRLGGADA